MSRAKDKSYNSRYDNEDDEVRYDEMGPNPQIQIHEQQQQLSQNLRHSEVPDKFLTKTRFQHRKSREQAQVNEDVRFSRADIAPNLNFLDHRARRSSSSIDTSTTFNLDSYAQQPSQWRPHLNSVVEDQQQQQQQNATPPSFTQDSLQADASSLLYLANANATTLSQAPLIVNATQISQATSQAKFTETLEDDNVLTSTQPSQTELENANMAETINRRVGPNRFDHTAYPWESRSNWRPSSKSSGFNDGGDESYNFTPKENVEPIMKDLALDRPSHWGSKPKNLKRSSFPEKTSFPLKNKKPKASSDKRSSFEMPAHFPARKEPVDVKKMKSISFKPAWITQSPATSKESSSRGNRRGEINQDDIQDIEGNETFASDNDDMRDRSAFASSSSSSTTPQHSLSLPLSTVWATKDQYDGGMRLQGRPREGWRSPDSAGKAVRGGKKNRAKAGSFKALYQKLHRSVEEKECRMLNIEASVNDPQDPRNRAAFFVDLTVIEDEGEQWPFHVIIVRVNRLEWKDQVGTSRSSVEKISFVVPLESLKENLQLISPNRDQNRRDGASSSAFYGQQNNQDLIQSDGRILEDGVGASSISLDISASHLVRNSEHNVDVFSVQIENAREIETVEDDFKVRTDAGTETDLKKGNSDVNASAFKEGTYSRAYFKAESFRGGKGRNFQTGCVIRVYEPEILQGSEVDRNDAVDSAYAASNSGTSNRSNTGSDIARDWGKIDPLHMVGTPHSYNVHDPSITSFRGSTEGIHPIANLINDAISSDNIFLLRQQALADNSKGHASSGPTDVEDIQSKESLSKIICTQLYELLTQQM